jgi:hypothetical protein
VKYKVRIVDEHDSIKFEYEFDTEEDVDEQMVQILNDLQMDLRELATKCEFCHEAYTLVRAQDGNARHSCCGARANETSEKTK